MNAPASPLPLESLLHAYRDGDPQAAAALLTRFEAYLGKWHRLLTFGRWDHADGELRHFLALFGGRDPVGTAQRLSRRLATYEPADLEQELTVAFLDTARTGEQLTARFRFTLWRRLDKLLKDPLTFAPEQVIAWEEGPDEPAALAPPELNAAWVDGVTCGPGFDELSCEERLILVLKHSHGYSIEETAERVGVSVSTINRALRRIRLVLAEHYR